MSWDGGSAGGWDNSIDSDASWGSDTDPIDSTHVSNPPVVWLWLGVATAVSSLILIFVGNSLWLNIVGWFLAGLVAITFLGVFFVKDLARRGTGWAAESAVADYLRVGLVVLAFLAVVFHSGAIADVLARREW